MHRDVKLATAPECQKQTIAIKPFSPGVAYLMKMGKCN
jgi:hypothetical protein